MLNSIRSIKSNHVDYYLFLHELRNSPVCHHPDIIVLQNYRISWNYSPHAQKIWTDTNQNVLSYMVNSVGRSLFLLSLKLRGKIHRRQSVFKNIRSISDVIYFTDNTVHHKMQVSGLPSVLVLLRFAYAPPTVMSIDFLRLKYYKLLFGHFP